MKSKQKKIAIMTGLAVVAPVTIVNLTTISCKDSKKNKQKQKSNERSNETRPITRIEKDVIEFAKIGNNNVEITRVFNSDFLEVQIPFKSEDSFDVEIVLNKNLLEFNIEDSGFTNPTIEYKIEEENENFVISNDGKLKSKNKLSPDIREYSVKVKATVKEENRKTQAFDFVIKLENEHIPSKIKPTTPINDINKDILSNVSIKGILTSLEYDDSASKNIKIKYNSSVNYGVSIDLKNQYEIFGNLGFTSPTISFSTSSTNFEISKDQNIARITNISPIDANEKNIKISISIKMEEEGYQSQVFGFVIELINLYEPIVEKPTVPTNPITPPVVKNIPPRLNVDYFLDKNMPHGQENNKEYWITNPYTQNHEILSQWGNIPLPMKKNIDENDLYKMFELIAIKEYSFSMTCGERLIESDLLNNTFVKWLTENWKKYPRLAFNNPTLRFSLKDYSQYNLDVLRQNKNNLEEFFRDKKYYIQEISNLHFSDLIAFPTQEREDFIYAIDTFFTNYARPDMSDLDKIFAVYNFVGTWMNYSERWSHTEYAFWSKHEGLCVYYAYVSALLLNIMGVKAIPMNVGTVNQGSDYRNAHMLVWVWTDAENKNQYKWYLMDPTFGFWRSKRKVYNKMPEANMPVDYDNYKHMLRAVYEDKWGVKNFEFGVQQNAFYGFSYAPWLSQYYEDKVSYGKFNLADSSKFINEVYAGKTNRYLNGDVSRPAFFNGEWYVFACDRYDSKKTKLIKYPINSTDPRKAYGEDITNTIPKDIYEKYLENKNSRSLKKPYLAQYRDWIVILLNEDPYQTGQSISKDRTFVIHNMNDTEWKNTITFTIENDSILEIPTKNGGKRLILTNESWIDTFFVYNGKLRVKYRIKTNSATYEKIVDYNIPEDPMSLENDNYISKKEIDIAKKHYLTLINSLQIGNHDYGLTLEKKQSINERISNIESSSVPRETLIGIKNLYEETIKESIINKGKLLPKKLHDEVYYIDRRNFNEYGFTIDFVKGFESFSSISKNQTRYLMRYDIYKYVDNNGGMELEPIAINLYEPKIIKEYLNGKDPYGYYQVKYYSAENPDHKFDSPIFKISNVEDENIKINDNIDVESKSITGETKRHFLPSNYSSTISDWDSREVSLKLKTNIAQGQKVKMKLNFLSFATKTTKTIREIQLSTSRVDFEHTIGKINNENKGIYFIQFEYSVGETKYSSYTDFVYIFGKDDIEENTFDQWYELSSLLKNKNSNL